jgi:tRNA G46 methylase TrmB
MYIDGEGFLDLKKVFLETELSSVAPNRKRGGRAIHIEIGSGFGDWIVHQAQQNQSEDYVAVELRADRVAQTFMKTMLTVPRLQNLVSVGAECGSFLRERIRPNTVASIFVNYPEPPTQTYGASESALSEILSGGQEPAHMLNSSTLRVALCCLDPKNSGRLVIVTDNRWYARLICVTLVKALRCLSHLFNSVKLDEKGFTPVETFSEDNIDVVLYEGQPSAALGQPQGSSYFDRLWSHSKKRLRFVVMIETVIVCDANAGNFGKKPRKAGKRAREKMKRSKVDLTAAYI